MCGVAGFLDTRLGAEAAEAAIRRMLGRILHRGPDEQGFAAGEGVALGVVRLAIVDIAAGQQPMATPDGRFWLAFNGEIFNHVELRAALAAEGVAFRTRSDTEVLLQGLALRGRDFLKRLNGQFAFAFHDRLRGETLFARDRFGERPLFLSRQDGGLVFGSEIKAVAAYPGVTLTLDPARARDALRAWATLPGDTPFREVEALEPGTAALWRAGRLERWRYDDVLSDALAAGRDAAMPHAEAEARLRAGLERAVDLRLRADLEVGAYVSGGIDSAVIAGLAQQRIDAPLQTFSIRFDAADYDEGAHQAAVVAALRAGGRAVVHHEVHVRARDYHEHLSDVVWHAESMLFRLAPLPMHLLARLVRERGLKVVLTGEGADEFLFGYDIYRETATRLALETSNLPQAARREMVAALYPYLDQFRGDGADHQLRFFAGQAGDVDDPAYGHRLRFAVGAFAERLMPPEAVADAPSFAQRLRETLLRRAPGLTAADPLERAMVVEAETLLGGYLLSAQGDRVSSAHAVEARYPFLDPDLVAAVCRLPRESLLRGGREEKHALKTAFRDLVPASVIARAKHPFRAPDAQLLFEGEGRDLLPDRAAIAAAGVFDPDRAGRFLAGLPAGLAAGRPLAQREAQALCAIVTSALLHRRFAEAASAPARPLPNLVVARRLGPAVAA